MKPPTFRCSLKTSKTYELELGLLAERAAPGAFELDAAQTHARSTLFKLTEALTL